MASQRCKLRFPQPKGFGEPSERLIDVVHAVSTNRRCEAEVRDVLTRKRCVWQIMAIAINNRVVELSDLPSSKQCDDGNGPQRQQYEENGHGPPHTVLRLGG